MLSVELAQSFTLYPNAKINIFEVYDSVKVIGKQYFNLVEYYKYIVFCIKTL